MKRKYQRLEKKIAGLLKEEQDKAQRNNPLVQYSVTNNAGHWPVKRKRYDFRDLVQYDLYFHISNRDDIQDEVKKYITKFVERNKLYIITAKLYDPYPPESFGEYVDPFENKVDNKLLFDNEIPKDINHCHIYFLTKKDMERFRRKQKSLKKKK